MVRNYIYLKIVLCLCGKLILFLYYSVQHQVSGERNGKL